jgi:hypothetical protein
LTLGGLAGTGVVSTTVSIFETELAAALYTGGGVAPLTDFVVSRVGVLKLSIAPLLQGAE